MIDAQRMPHREHYQQFLKLNCSCKVMNCYLYLGYRVYAQETHKVANWGKVKLLKKKQLLRQLFENNLTEPDVGMEPVIQFSVQGSIVCKGTWMHLNDISDYLYEKMHRVVIAGEVDIHGNLGMVKVATLKSISISTIMVEVKRIGETYIDGTIHVPTCYNKAEFYSMVKAKYPDMQLCEHSVFYSLFHNELSMVKFPKKTCLGKCDECIKLSMLRSKATTKALQDVFAQARKDHLLLVWAERATISADV